MAIIKEEQIINETVIEIAKKIIIAARTAPKARGKNNLVTAIVTGDDIKVFSDKMIGISQQTGEAFFARDAANILNAEAIVLLGSKYETYGLKKCGYCGFKSCDDPTRPKTTACAFHNVDLGIAIGSAVSIASNHRIDNRIMYTIGQAALELNIFDKDVKIVFGIPLSVTSKSPFFDRA
ncbi:MAG: DUF2148 domain-containing protein [Saprospiraceae bacterium]|nr:DUF2148 domain-containing protein [Saprospiraceae bacterium]